jgi:transcriptional antiterminator RfaH
MPVLPLEPFVFPDDLLQSSRTAAEDGSRWWVLHTRPRAEKCLARRLLGRGLPFFLPLYKRQWRNRQRVLRSYVPLFPSYVFLHGEGVARLHALETNLIARVLAVEDQRQLEADLARVYRMVTSDAPVLPEDRLEPGTQVDITAGPLTGLQGTVLRRGKQLKLYVEVQFLRRGVSVEIESWMIQPLESRRPSTTKA